MKSIYKILTVLLTVISINAMAKGGKHHVTAPAKATQQVMAKYPEEKNIHWKEKAGYFKTHFFYGGKKVMMVFDSNGNLVSAKEKMVDNPATVQYNHEGF